MVETMFFITTINTSGQIISQEIGYGCIRVVSDEDDHTLLMEISEVSDEAVFNLFIRVPDDGAIMEASAEADHCQYELLRTRKGE